jgi:hypothetical protein
MSQRLKLGAKLEIENMCIAFLCLTPLHKQGEGQGKVQQGQGKVQGQDTNVRGQGQEQDSQGCHSFTERRAQPAPPWLG